MNYWFDVDIKRKKVTSGIFEYGMIDQTKNKKLYPNINKIKTGDKVIFVKSLVCYADGIIKKFNFNSNHSGNRIDPYPINIEYDVKVWKKDVPLRGSVGELLIKSGKNQRSSHFLVLLANKPFAGDF